MVQQRPDASLDNDAYVLSPYELATFLAYTYTGSTPDDELLQAAADNALTTDAQLQAHIDRLLLTSKAREHFGEFAAQWLRTDRVVSVVKDTNVFPDFTLDVRQAMAQEVREIFKHVMFDGNQPIDNLYGDFTFLNSDLATFYGISGNYNNTFTKIDGLNDRGGILTSGAFMTGFANQSETSPIQRAVSVREDMMCQTVPPMPTDLDILRDDAANSLEAYIQSQGGIISNRERYHFLTKDVPCSDCHKEIINPHGFGMEDFDAVGRARLVDANDLLIDADGQLIGLSALNDGDVRSFVGAKQLSSHLQGLPATRSCFVQKSFRYVMGTGHDEFEHGNSSGPQLSNAEKAGYSCTLNVMNDAMSAANYNPRQALRTLGVRDIVRYRK